MNHYTDIPNWLFERRDLTAMQRWLYVCLLHASESRQSFTLSAKTIATYNSTISSLRTLEEKGLIRYDWSEDGMSYIMEILPQADGSEEVR